MKEKPEWAKKRDEDLRLQEREDSQRWYPGGNAFVPANPRASFSAADGSPSLSGSGRSGDNWSPSQNPPIMESGSCFPVCSSGPLGPQAPSMAELDKSYDWWMALEDSADPDPIPPSQTALVVRTHEFWNGSVPYDKADNTFCAEFPLVVKNVKDSAAMSQPEVAEKVEDMYNICQDQESLSALCMVYAVHYSFQIVPEVVDKEIARQPWGSKGMDAFNKFKIFTDKVEVSPQVMFRMCSMLESEKNYHIKRSQLRDNPEVDAHFTNDVLNGLQGRDPEFAPVRSPSIFDAPKSPSIDVGDILKKVEDDEGTDAESKAHQNPEDTSGGYRHDLAQVDLEGIPDDLPEIMTDENASQDLSHLFEDKHADADEPKAPATKGKKHLAIRKPPDINFDNLFIQTPTATKRKKAPTAEKRKADQEHDGKHEREINQGLAHGEETHPEGKHPHHREETDREREPHQREELHRGKEVHHREETHRREEACKGKETQHENQAGGKDDGTKKKRAPAKPKKPKEKEPKPKSKDKSDNPNEAPENPKEKLGKRTFPKSRGKPPKDPEEMAKVSRERTRRYQIQAQADVKLRQQGKNSNFHFEANLIVKRFLGSYRKADDFVGLDESLEHLIQVFQRISGGNRIPFHVKEGRCESDSDEPQGCLQGIIAQTVVPKCYQEMMSELQFFAGPDTALFKDLFESPEGFMLCFQQRVTKIVNGFCQKHKILDPTFYPDYIELSLLRHVKKYPDPVENELPYLAKVMGITERQIKTKLLNLRSHLKTKYTTLDADAREVVEDIDNLELRMAERAARAAEGAGPSSPPDPGAPLGSPSPRAGGAAGVHLGPPSPSSATAVGLGPIAVGLGPVPAPVGTPPTPLSRRGGGESSRPGHFLIPEQLTFRMRRWLIDNGKNLTIKHRYPEKKETDQWLADYQEENPDFRTKINRRDITNFIRTYQSRNRAQFPKLYNYDPILVEDAAVNVNNADQSQDRGESSGAQIETGDAEDSGE